MKIVSACLVGIKCNWKGECRTDAELQSDFLAGKLLPVCPEVLGGASVPRNAAEIRGGSGQEVLDGRTAVFDSEGNDVTRVFISGAEEVLRIAKREGATEAILKSKSPSCGCGRTYDGTFSRTLVDGDGVTAALLKRNGIKVVSEGSGTELKKWRA